jgi:hypothetical protein
MLSRSQKRVVLGAAIFVLIVLFAVPYIKLSSYRDSVANALSNAVGRKVTVQDISLQTFPQPGLLLKGLVVEDDLSINAEPMIRADEVLATLRFTSLWRGRLEIASLKLHYPSLNLARSNDGRWNLASLLERARQTPSAPTARPRPETRLRFPYIEASNGRINLKIGQEKKVFALGEADFALWLASEDEWRMRLEARPIRTDANLSDTGTIKVEGSWKRAAQLHDTPLTFRFWWDSAQLGNMTALIYGHDRGWRGAVRGSGIVQGRPDDLKIIANARIDDFRRYDIPSGDAITLQAKCDASYSFTRKQVRDLYCQSPMGNGNVILSGSFGLNPGERNADMSISAESIPAQFLATLLHHVRSNVPEDVSAKGTVSAALTLRSDENENREWTGSGQTSPLEVSSSVLPIPLQLPPTKWRLIGPGTPQSSAPAKAARVIRARQEEALPLPDSPAFSFEPIDLPGGAASPVLLTGWAARSGYAFELKGDAELSQLIGIARLAGLPSTSAELSGSVKGKLRATGDWAGTAPVQYVGDAQLQKVTAKMNGVASPINIASARFSANSSEVTLSKVSADIQGAKMRFDLSAVWPRDCIGTEPKEKALCGARFELKTDQIDIDEINALINPKAQKKPWYSSIPGFSGGPRQNLPAFYASGQITANKLVMKSLVASRASAELKITPQDFTVVGLTADLLGGNFIGDIHADFASGTPSYSSSGNLVNISIGNVAALTREAWGNGKLTGSYKGSAKGWKAEEIISSLAGTGTFDWREGTLQHLDLEGRGKPLQFKDFNGTVGLSKGVMSISESKLLAGKSIYLVSGTASLGRELELKLERDGEPGYSVGGTLDSPKVVQVNAPQTQASLKQNTK